MFWQKVSENVLDALSTGLVRLRTDFDALRTLVVQQDTAIKILQNERTVREAELADLRTRMQTIIARIGMRQQRDEERNESEDSEDFRLIQARRRGK